jgi:homoserine dehydrogenase
MAAIRLLSKEQGKFYPSKEEGIANSGSAGGEVTAMGVTGDLIKVLRSLH